MSSCVVQFVGVVAFNVVVNVASMASGQALDWDVRVSAHTDADTHRHRHRHRQTDRQRQRQRDGRRGERERET